MRHTVARSDSRSGSYAGEHLLAAARHPQLEQFGLSRVARRVLRVDGTEPATGWDRWSYRSFYGRRTYPCRVRTVITVAV